MNSNIYFVLVSNLNLYRSWLNSLNKIFPRVVIPRESPREINFTCWQRGAVPRPFPRNQFPREIGVPYRFPENRRAMDLFPSNISLGTVPHQRS